MKRDHKLYFRSVLLHLSAQCLYLRRGLCHRPPDEAEVRGPAPLAGGAGDAGPHRYRPVRARPHCGQCRHPAGLPGGRPLGAALSILGTILPPFLILSVVSLFYTAFRENRVVAAVLKGMQAGVSAVIASVVMDMGGDILRRREWLPTAIMVGAFLVTLLWDGLNVAWILLACALLGITATFAFQRRKEGSS